MIIGRSHTPLNSSRTIGSVRQRDDNSRGKVQNVRGDSSANFGSVKNPLLMHGVDVGRHPLFRLDDSDPSVV
jgi:hypothetical protein